MSTLSPIDLALLLHASSDQAEHTLTSLLLSLPSSLIDPSQPSTSTNTTPPKLPHRTQLLLSHRASNLLDLVVNNSSSLVDIYKDSKGEFKEEIDVIGGRGEPGGDLIEFYERLGKLKESHRKYPNAGSSFSSVLFNPDSISSSLGMIGVNEENEFEILEKMFTGEEFFGKYFDLNQDFERFINLKLIDGKKHSYLSYLSTFDDFSNIPQPTKLTPQYLTYVTKLFENLKSFVSRAFPLTDLDKIIQSGDKEFEDKWSKGQIPGWAHSANDQNGVWCPACEFLPVSTLDPSHLIGN
jgi:splicing factor 3A subunit 3